MQKLAPFVLEEFLYRYEHDPGLFNLATSDTLPWSFEEVKAKCPSLGVVLANLKFDYPNVKDCAVDSIRSFLNVPGGIDVLPTGGAAEAIFLALLERVVHNGKAMRITLPQPCFGVFEGVPGLFGLEVRRYSYRQRSAWQIDVDELLDMSRESDVVVINSPHNPTGRVLAPDVIQELVRIANNHGSFLIIDAVFQLPEEARTFSWDSRNVVVLGSLSKVYGLPGLRFGWVAGPCEVISRMRTLQQYSTLSVSSIGAAIGPRVLAEPEFFSRGTLLKTNMGLLNGWAEQHRDLIKLSTAEGGTTVILELASTLSERELFDLLLHEKVLLAPGMECFGAGESAWFRLGYGGETTQLNQGLAQIEKALKSVQA